MFYPLHYFGFDDELVFTYTAGRCWYLVHALVEATGLEPVAFWAEGLIYHVGVLLPDGTIVDALGVWDPQTWENRWAKKLEVNRGGVPPIGVLVAPPDTRDGYWQESVEVYETEDMLTEELYLSHTLEGLTRAIVNILVSRNLLEE